MAALVGYIFDQAKRENKFVMLDLEAVWCHWCHVMDETTYKTPEVIALIQSKYIPVRVDQDSLGRTFRIAMKTTAGRPRWCFGSGGREIVKRQGYIEPADGRDVEGDHRRSEARPLSSSRSGNEVRRIIRCFRTELRQELERRYFGQYDSKHGSWGFDQKFLDWNSTEYAMARARAGEQKSAQMARQTFNAQFNLIDPRVGRRIPILGGRRLEPAAFRKDHEHAGGQSAHLLAGL